MHEQEREHPESSAATYNGVPVDNPLVISTIRNGIKMGWNNETICRVVEIPGSVVDKHRSLMKKEQMAK
jgi:hypothetical protein